MSNLDAYISDCGEWGMFVKVDSFFPQLLRRDCWILVYSTGGGVKSADIVNFSKEDRNTCRDFFNSFDLLSGHQMK